MILHLENGRLGNQLFQYIGLKRYFPKDKIIYLGFKNPQESFDNFNIYFLNMKRIYNIFFILLKSIIIFLTKIRVLGKIYEDLESKNYKINIKKGIFRRVSVCCDCYFQHKDVIEKIDNPPILKSQIHKKALNWFKEKGIDSKKDKIVFVHIRRGDYLNYPSKEFPAVLDINWYMRAINFLQEKLQTPIFILMSDDQQYLKDIFKETSSMFISNNESEIDLSIMSLCSAGILSPSSFAWWGAYYVKIYNRDIDYFLAPKYWLGHRSRMWNPLNFYTKWITYVE